jgi:hypothetical protein
MKETGMPYRPSSPLQAPVTGKFFLEDQLAETALRQKQDRDRAYAEASVRDLDANDRPASLWMRLRRALRRSA